MAKGKTWKTRLSELTRDVVVADDDVREGRFQKTLSLIAGLSSVLSGAEVAYEHYRGSYGQRVMYAPVILSPLLLIAGIGGFFNKTIARKVLPAISGVTLASCLIGFGYHIRGIARKPGGWRLPVVNIIMGPPLFAPLLFGVSGYLGLIASFLRREEAPEGPSVHPAARPLRSLMEMTRSKPSSGNSRSESSDSSGSGKKSWEQDLREGRFQKHLAAATAASSLFSGIEALYSHYKNNFQYRVQWTPVIVSPLLSVCATAAIFNRRAAKTLLPLASLTALLNGSEGFYFHLRGVLKRPGGIKKLGYNIIYGPPILAPLLFAACGFLGLLASIMRRES